MAKQIIWSLTVQLDRKEILLYWINRNKSRTYSKKLNKLFIEAIQLIAEFPEIGKPTTHKTARIKIVRDYLIVYEYDTTKNQIIILRIWDSRQNPNLISNY